jgi:hypothetical protein
MFPIRRKSKTLKPLRDARRPWVPVVQVLEDRTLLSFNAPLSLPAGQFPQGITAVDLTGNHIQDLVVTNQGFPSHGDFSTVEILMGNGDGTFQPATNYLVGSAPADLTVGKFNGDGSLDVAVADSLTNQVSLISNQAGTTRPGPASAAAGKRADGTVAAPVSLRTAQPAVPTSTAEPLTPTPAESLERARRDGVLVGGRVGNTASVPSPLTVALAPPRADTKLDEAPSAGDLGA